MEKAEKIQILHFRQLVMWPQASDRICLDPSADVSVQAALTSRETEDVWTGKDWLHGFLLLLLFLIFIYLASLFILQVGARSIFSCSTWDLVPCPGMDPGPPALGVQRLSH